MGQPGTDDRRLTQLHPLERNNIFYGKLMDVLHFTMEQDYGRANRQLFNRLALGSGVVCGLDVTAVTTAAGTGLRVSAGVALDGWGRWIVVPDDVDLVPLALTDDCGHPAPAAGEPLPAALHVSVCYRECPADYAPALVTDPVCDGPERCEAGTWIESYRLQVLEDAAPAVDLDCAAGVLDAVRAGELHAALCLLGGGACPTEPDDPCVVLANVAVAADGTLTVDACRPRAVVPTNRLLLQLVTCLAERVEECCPGPQPTPSPSPSPSPSPVPSPTPTPSPSPTPSPPPELLRVQRVRVLATGGDPATVTPTVVAEMTKPTASMTASVSKQPDVIEIEFTGALDPDSVAMPATIDVQRPTGLPLGQVSTGPGNLVRYYQPDGLRGTYTVRLIGGPPGPSADPAIRSLAGLRLDGDMTAAWPSGDGNEGGDFGFRLVVE